MMRQPVGAAAVALVLPLLVPAMRVEAGEAFDRVTRVLSAANANPTVAFPALSLRRATPATQPTADPAYAAYLKAVEAKLDAKARELGHPRYPGKVVICFHIGQDGRVSNRDLCVKSGNPEGDRFALAVVAAVDPLPPPPSTRMTGGVVWVYSFRDGPIH